MTNVKDQPRLFSQPDKGTGTLQPEYAVIPAQQGLGADHRASSQVHFGLIVEQEFGVGDSVLKLAGSQLHHCPTKGAVGVFGDG